MATEDYTHGEMDIHGQSATWDGFLQFSTWGGLITILTVGYATLALAMGMNWMIALGLMAALGVGAGLFLKMGGRWMATVVGLFVIALIVQAFIALFGVFLS
jgi:hypothetical protein